MRTVLTGSLLALFLFSCQKGKEMKTASGMQFVLFTESKGKKPVTGDWVTVNMVYKDEKDSVLFDSRTYGKPLRFALPAPKFRGSFEEGLMHIAEGDSAAFFISADSMYEKVITKEAEGHSVKRPDPGSFLRFDVSLVRVQPFREAEMEIAMNESNQEREERKTLEEYLEEKNRVAEMEPQGYYLLIEKKGSDTPISRGMNVKINYTGRFLDGKVFKSNSESGKPYEFKVGAGDVIAGWDLAFLKLHEGDQATMIIPSRLAYGADGIRMPNSLNYSVPPFSTLVFEVEVLKAEKE